MIRPIATAFALAGLLLLTTGAQAADGYEVTGFRGAKFGMSEDDVRGAIKKDFGIKDQGVQIKENPVEHTHVLSVVAPDLVPETGKAEVAYVLGYRSHKLIQVGVTWSAAVDSHVTAETLVNIANTLQAHFLSEGYKPDTVVTNGGLANGDLLVFRGADAKGHTTVLMMQGTHGKPDANGKQTLTPTSLNLFYAENPEKPDALKLQPGQF